MARAKSAKSAKFSTPWNPLSPVFHGMEPEFRCFSTAWNPLSEKVPRHGTRFCPRWRGGKNGSREVRQVRKVFHTMEACFGIFPRHGTMFRKNFHTMELGFAGFPRNGSMFSTPWKPLGAQAARLRWGEPSRRADATPRPTTARFPASGDAASSRVSPPTGVPSRPPTASPPSPGKTGSPNSSPPIPPASPASLPPHTPAHSFSRPRSSPAPTIPSEPRLRM